MTVHILNCAVQKHNSNLVSTCLIINYSCKQFGRLFLWDVITLHDLHVFGFTRLGGKPEGERVRRGAERIGGYFFQECMWERGGRGGDVTIAAMFVSQWQIVCYSARVTEAHQAIIP